MLFSFAVGDVGTQVGENFTILQRMVGETLVILQQRAIPQDLQSWSDYQPVRFVDALESRVLLPFEICRDFQVIALLKGYIPINAERFNRDSTVC